MAGVFAIGAKLLFFETNKKEMKMQLVINYGSILAFGIVCIGTIFQIIKTVQKKTVADISVIEILLRLSAGVLLWIKMFTTSDLYLIIGEGAWIVIYFCYCLLVVSLRIKDCKE